MSVDFVTTYGAIADGQLQTLTVSFTSGLLSVDVFSNTFNSGHVNKYIAVQDWIPTTGSNPMGAAPLKISAVGSFTAGKQTLTLAVIAGVGASTAAANTVSSASKLVEWGSDNGPAIIAFNAANVGATGVVMTITAGRYCIAAGTGGSPFVGSSIGFGLGIKGMTVNGTGSPTLSDFLGVGGGVVLNFSGQPLYNDNRAESRVQSVDAGATVLHMVTASDAAKYTASTWAWMTGFDVQGPPSTPPNFNFSQFVFITAVDTAGGTVTIQSPLTDSYKSYWPNWYPGVSDAPNPIPGSGTNAGHNSLGGPATLYMMNQLWDADHTWNGVNFRATPTVMNGSARRLTINNSIFEVFGPNTSMQQSFTASNITVSQNWELDKGTETISVSNSTIHGFIVQNPSPFNVVLDTVTFSGTTGTTKNWTMTNCSVPTGMVFGPSATGLAHSLSVTNCTFAGQTGIQGVKESDLVGAGYTLSNGVISRLRSAGTGAPPQWAAPGEYFFLGSRYNYESRAIRVIDITDDGTSIHITTDLGGSAWPVLNTGTSPSAITSPPRITTFTGNTGCDDALSWSAVTGSLYTRWKKTYTGNLTYDPTLHTIKMSGRFVSAKITVTSGYTAGTLHLDGPLVLVKPTGATTAWNPVIDLTAVGTRLINNDGTVTSFGTDSALAMPNGGNVGLLENQITPSTTGAVGSGTFTIEINADMAYSVPAVCQRKNMFSDPSRLDPSTYYNPGVGAPAISTSDYYHMLGSFGLRPYDLTQWGSPGIAIATARGRRYVWAFSADHPVLSARWRDGAAFRMGFTNDPGVMPSANDLFAIIPQNNTWSTGSQPVLSPLSGSNLYQNVWLMYNPDDANGWWFYLYGEGVTNSGPFPPIGHCGILLRSVDLVNWIPYGQSHFPDALASNAYCGFQRVRRISTGNWVSQGYGSKAIIPGYEAVWTSTDGLSFTLANTITQNTLINAIAPNTVVTAHFTAANTGLVTGNLQCTDMDQWTAAEAVAPGFDIGIAGVGTSGNQVFGKITSFTDARHIGVTLVSGKFFNTPITAQAVQVEWQKSVEVNPPQLGFGMTVDIIMNGTKYGVRQETAASHGSIYPIANIPADYEYISLVPIDPTTSQFLSRNPADFIRISANGDFVQSFPGPDFLQSLTSYSEDGLLHVYGSHGYITEVNIDQTGAIKGETLENSGSCKHQWINYYTYIYDVAAAALAAPVGVVAACNLGTVTISWYDALPQNTYRVYRGSTSTTQTTLVGNVSGTSITDAPTAGQQWWYKVVTISSATEQQSRVVHCYVSAAKQFINDHINRVIDDGGDPTTINVTYCSNVYNWLVAQGLYTSLLQWADPRCGVKVVSSNLNKIYDLGTTFLPRSRDLWPLTTSTSYSATGLGGGPCWTNSTTSAYLAFGGAGDPNDGTRFNQIRMKTQITCAALYHRTDTTVDCTFLGTSTSTSSGTDSSGVVPLYDGHGPGLSLTHASGTPGSINFLMADQTGTKTATVTGSGASIQVAIGTYDGSNMLAYSDGTAGSPNSSYSQPTLRYDTVLNGARVGNDNANDELHIPFLCSGSKEAHYNSSDGGGSTDLSSPFYPGSKPGPLAVPDRTFGQTNAKFTGGALVVLGKGVTATQATQLTTLLVTGVAPAGSLGGVAPLRLRLHA